MGSSVPQSAASILQRLFDVVLDEARTHPEFAEKLLRALPFDAIARIDVRAGVEGPQKKTPARKTAAEPAKKEKVRVEQDEPVAFDPNAFSLIAGLKTLGLEGLRDKLKAYNPQQLLSMADEQHLDVDEKAFKNRKRTTNEMVDTIIRALQSRIAGRIIASS
jgi:hypothetical protein